MSGRRPLVVLCPNLSSNCLGRALLLAELASPLRSVKIVGGMIGGDVWAPAQNASTSIVGCDLRSFADLPRLCALLRAEAHDGIVLVSKPLTTSLGVAVASLAQSQVALDIDDWEVGLVSSERAPVRTQLRALVHPRRLNSYLSTALWERVVPNFPVRLVSNRFLQKKFGGALLYHVRDPLRLGPDPARVRKFRQTLELEGRTWVGFVGTPRRHKGLDLLVEALAGLRGDNAPGLFLAGIDPRSAYGCGLVTSALLRLGPGRLRTVGQFPLEQLPGMVEAADVIALPSLAGPEAQGQVPAKLFDAMALGKPIVASRVGDHEYVLSDGGITFPAGDAEALAAAIMRLVENPQCRQDLGHAARARLISQFSYEAGSAILDASLECMS